jgi:hypothetical protein
MSATPARGQSSNEGQSSKQVSTALELPIRNLQVNIQLRRGCRNTIHTVTARCDYKITNYKI